MIRFNAESKRFEINIEGILSLRLPEDMPSLMKLRLKDMGPSEMEILQIASCIGPRVSKSFPCSSSLSLSIQLFVALDNASIGPEDIEHILWKALRARFISPLFTNYAVSTRKYHEKKVDYSSLGINWRSAPSDSSAKYSGTLFDFGN